MAGKGAPMLLWLFVINLGISFGAGLYESRIVLSDWLSSSDSMRHWNAAVARHDNTGVRFWAFVTTVPLTLLTLANAFAAWRSGGQLRSWWLTSAVCALLERTFTFSYFIPAMVGLMQMSDSPTSVKTAAVWMNLNYLRHTMLLMAWLAGLKAFSLASRSQIDG
jgi:hypothetical protein